MFGSLIEKSHTLADTPFMILQLLCVIWELAFVAEKPKIRAEAMLFSPCKKVFNYRYSDGNVD